MLIPWMDHVEAQPLPSWNGSCENHAELLWVKERHYECGAVRSCSVVCLSFFQLRLGCFWDWACLLSFGLSSTGHSSLMFINQLIILKWDDKDIRTTESKNVSNRVFWQEIPESFKWQVPQDGIAAMGSVILALSLAPWQNRTVPDKDLQGWRQTSSDFSNSNGAVWYPDLKFVEHTGALGERECCADNRWRLVGRILKIERF